jgi:hypothetical protein
MGMVTQRRMARVMTISINGLAQMVEIDAEDLSQMQQLIGGGWIETVSARGWYLICDEEGKFKNLPVNEPATQLAKNMLPQGFHDQLRGPVVLAGWRPDGSTVDLPDEAARMAQYYVTLM